MFLWILCCQGLFILIQESFGQKVVDSIQGQLRQELAVSNFNFLARSITDFTVSGAIECGVLDKKTPYEMKIIDLRYMAKGCSINRWSLNGLKLEVLLKSLNGDEYKFSFISKNTELFYIALWGFRLLGLVAILGIALAIKTITNSEMEIARRMKNLALEVSHDIRSPLSSLTMMLKEYNFNNPDERKVVLASLERINDIANNLLSLNKSEIVDNSYESRLLIPLISSVISEKRIQFSEIKNLKIITSFNCSPFTSVFLDESLFQRAISNLLNNSIEAIVDHSEIHVTLNEELNVMQLVIEDFGCGMPPEVLQKIGERGFTTKDKFLNAGHGIGFSSSIETIRKFGGKINVISTQGKGTKIVIQLPKSPNPIWLVKGINLNLYEEVWILDDDPSIHYQWSKRIGGVVRNFYSIEDFRTQLEKSTSKKRLFLVDYELNAIKNGLDTMMELNIDQSSILVTSIFDTKEILKKVTAHGIRMIPKYLIEHIEVSGYSAEAYEYVYIDDDAILRMGWEMNAKKNNVNLLTLSHTDEFFKNDSKINKDLTKIFIDSNLGSNSVRGEEFASDLYQRGYKNLFLATGYPKEEFSQYPWLSIIGKSCPF